MKKYIFLGALLCLMTNLRTWSQTKAFIQNVGQITDQHLQSRTDIDAKVSGQKGLQVFVGKGQLHYQWMEAIKEEDSTIGYESYRLDMHLVGANPNATLTYGQQQAGFERYFLSWVNTDNSNEGKVAHQYAELTYHNIYPNIDWRLYFTLTGELEYDFIVHPGGKVSAIQMQYSGSDGIIKNVDGSLSIQTPKGSIQERAPYSYDAQTNEVIASNFVVNNYIISFQTAAHTGTVVIDPVIEWGTYFGDLAADAANDVTVDSQGNIYMVGTTSSIANIATTGSHQQLLGGGSSDGFISKFNATGNLLWATYYGGNKVDVIKRISIGTDGLLYVGGYTNSDTGIATALSYQPALNGNQYDVFWAVFDTSGARQYATYFGGSSNEGNTAMDMALDQDNNIYMVGTTNSLNYPFTSNAYRTTGQSGESFLAKFSSQGQIVYSTFIGGELADVATGIAVDENKNMYITGYTKSITGIATPGAFQIANQGGDDGFLFKFDSLGYVVWSTYFGGPSNERLNAIAISDSFIIVGGQTRSSNNIASLGAHQVVYRGGINGTFDDGMLACFSLDGNRLWSTYYGGPNYDYIFDVSILHDSLIYCLMTTRSDTNIATANSINGAFSGGVDLALIKMDKNGGLIMGSYFGGSDIESTEKLAVSSSYEVLLCGRTLSGSNIAFGNSYQNNLIGGYDAFLIKILDCDAPILDNIIIGVDSQCAHMVQEYSINLQPGAVLYHWQLPTGWQGQSDSNSIQVTTGPQGGTIKVWAESVCGGISDTVTKEVYVYPTLNVIITQQNALLRTNAVYPSYQWQKDGLDILGATNSTYIPTTNGVFTLKVVDENGCVSISNEISIDGLSIKETNIAKVKIYPNPASTAITIELDKDAQIDVFNALGQHIATWNLKSGKHSQEIDNWTNGVYVVQIVNNEGVFIHQLMKQ